MFSLRRVIPTVSRFTASLSHLAPLSTVLPSKTTVFYQVVHSGTDGPIELLNPTGPKDTDGFKISLLSWNIGGMDPRSLETRMLAVSETASRINANFVLLQEVSELGIDKLLLLNNFYNIHFSNRNSKHFTAILVRKGFSVLNNEVIPYENSGRDRTLQIIEGKMGFFHVFLLNTHLESRILNATIRQEQLEQCFDKIDSISKEYPNALIFYGGDLNLRDEEIGDLPTEFGDAWHEAGARKKWMDTWVRIFKKNKNEECPLTEVGRRFDRIIYKKNNVIKVTFTLKGKQLIPESNCYPSDHWAIHSTFSVRCDPKNEV